MQQVIIGREYPDFITSLVKQAKQSIKILIYDWRWYSSEIGSSIQNFNNELLNSANRGVGVSVLVNNDYIVPILKDSKIDIKKVNTKKVMHVKMIIIDNKYLVLGSHNLTKNAFELNHEISVFVDDQESVNRCITFFENLCLL
ncbi:MAG: phospholipase D-like domain-containing protein [Patescibacteria group bacterium]